MRQVGSSSGPFKLIIAAGICILVIGIVGTSLYSIPERKTVTLTLPAALSGGDHHSSQIRLDGRYASHISGSFSFQKNITYNQNVPGPGNGGPYFEPVGDWPEFYIWTPDGPNATPHFHSIVNYWSNEPQENFSVDLPNSQVYYLNATYFAWEPSTSITVVIHYDVSGAKVDYSRVFISVLAGGVFLLFGGGILRRMYPMIPSRMADAHHD